MDNKFVYIGVGSNIEPENNILTALKILQNYVIIADISPVFITSPIGGDPRQPDFMNCVIKTELKKTFTPLEFKFNILRPIEKQLKRIRTEDKYMPRTIDLDILIFQDMIVENSNIKIPDPDIFNRDFLFAGLLYLEPNITVYPQNKSLISLVPNYQIDKLTINCKFTEKLWKEFLINEYRPGC